MIFAVGNAAGSESSRSYIKRNVPAMIEKWGKAHPDLPYNLCPHLERCISSLPEVPGGAGQQEGSSEQCIEFIE
jgi:hypothetical protein